MKNIKYIFIFAALAAISCARLEPLQTETAGNAAGDGTLVTFNASMEDQSKATINILSVEWENTDTVKVYNNRNSADFTPTNIIDGSKAVLEGTLTLVKDKMTYAIYPSSAAVSCSAGVVTATLPYQQFIPVDKTVDPSALLFVAATKTNAMHFKNACSIIKVTITGDDVTGIVIYGKNGENIAGTAEINMGFAEPVVKVTEGRNFIDVRRPDYSAFAPGEYYIPLFPTEFTGGIRVGVRKARCKEWTLGNSGPLTLVRNGGVEYTVGVGLKDSDLKLLARQMYDIQEAGAAGLSVKLANDIDMAGQSVAGVPFKGSLDGDGHNIYNFKAEGSENVGFFSAINGEAVIKNVKFGTGDGENYDGVSVITPDSEPETTVYAGIVARVELGASLTVKDVANFAPITTAGTPTVSYVGGLIGGADGSIDIDGAENIGAIVIGATGKVYTGGIVGDIRAGGTISIKNATNNAPLTCSAETSGQTYLGGLVGRGQNSTQTLNVDHCVNNGRICNSKCASGTMYCAGMVGNIGTGGDPKVPGTINYTDCINNGNVENEVKVGMRLAGFTASVYGVQTAKDCINNGAVIASLANTTTDIGGFVGKNTGPQGGSKSSYIRCSNKGNITILNAKASSNLTCGGIVGYGSNQNEQSFIDCINYGKIKVEGVSNVSTSSSGGLAGRLDKTSSITSSISFCAIESSSAKTCASGQLVGWCYATCTAEKSGIGGSINDTDVTDFLQEATGKGTLHATDCYVIPQPQP